MTLSSLQRFKYLLLVLGQFVMYVATYEICWRLLHWLYKDLRRDISWGITAKYSICIFFSLSIAGAIVSRYVLPGYKWVVYCFCIAIFVIFFLDVWTYMPYRITLLVLCGGISFGVPLIIFMKYSENSRCVNK